MRNFPLSVLTVLSLGLGSASAQQQPEGTAEPGAERPSAEADTGGAGESLEDMLNADSARVRGETLFSDSYEHESIGEIQEIVRGSDDGELYVVISSEEPLSVDSQTVVPLRELQLVNGDIVYSGDAEELLRKFDEEPYQEARYQAVDEDDIG